MRTEVPSPFPMPEGGRSGSGILRRLPVGAELQPDGGAHVRVWAPASPTVAVELFSDRGDVEKTIPLVPESDGYFSGLVPQLASGALYKLRLATGAFPDPASRFQPQGPHGPSRVVDPGSFRWTDSAWRGRPARERVIYELHLGTFTTEGTWRAALEQLPELQQLGITVLEVMPIADFAGQFGWGYDGVDLFAPCRLYGSPDDARIFIDRAHELGLMVILDVVYNHVGPDGNYLRQFSPDYFSTKYPCEWGDAINFDGPHCGPVREFYLSNVRYWIDEFHFDGLRLDATQQIFDASKPDILTEIVRVAREAGGNRAIYLVAENESQLGRLVRAPEAGGCGIDAMWNDDFHHTAAVAATGRAEAYYLDYRGTAQEFVSALKYGFLFQGQRCAWQKQRRGRPALDLPPQAFIIFLQNHDQVANSLRGERLHQLTSPGMFRALTAVLLLAPGTPLLFQGQEFGASSPFLYFADHHAELSKSVREGRGKFLAQFRSIACAESGGVLAEPGDRGTFERCKLDFTERQTRAAINRLHADLLRLRREDGTVAAPARIDGAVLDDGVFLIRYFSPVGDDRLLIVNLGAERYLNVVPEPLLAPLEDRGWNALWSSESVRYGGGGTPPLETSAGWIIPGRAAVLLRPDENAELPHASLSEKN